MRFLWRSRSDGAAGAATRFLFESQTTVESLLYPGVKLRIARVSFAGRLELMRRVRDLAQRTEFLKAAKDPAERIGAAVLQAEIDQLYVAWGVKEVDGLVVDGVPAGPDRLAHGPEGLFREALAAVRREIGLSEEERKNS
jgi:hypothetical protein